MDSIHKLIGWLQLTYWLKNKTVVYKAIFEEGH